MYVKYAGKVSKNLGMHQAAKIVPEIAVIQLFIKFNILRLN